MSLTTHAIDTTRTPVSCPGCDKTRPASPGRYLCADCGTWFDVRDD